MRKLTNEDIIYLLAFALALGVRLLNLGDPPLSESEAGLAIQAFDLARGESIVPAPQPAYIALTSTIFSLFGSSNALARFWPALAGSLLVMTPFAFRHVLGRKAALILAFGLALDPGLVALSRQADGRMLAIGFSIVALALAYDRKPAGAGIFTGLMLLSGPSTWLGLIGMAIAWGVWRFLGAETLEHDEPTSSQNSASPGFLRTWILFAMGTILIVGTRFFTFPSGIGAWASSIAAFAQGWVKPSGISIGRTMVAVVVYQPLALIFAIVAIVREWEYRRNLVWSLGAWALSGLVLAMAFTGRQVGDVAWALVPLWSLGAIGISGYFDERTKDPVSLGQSAAILVLLALAWLTLAGLHLTVAEAIRLRILVVVGIIALAGLTTAFVTLGWNWAIARAGAVFGACAALTLYGISAMVGTSQVHAGSPAELWAPTPRTGQAKLFVETLRELSITHTGDANAVDIVSLVESSALDWVLRDYQKTAQATAVDADILPPVVIAPLGSEAQAWSAAYRGQDFIWELNPGWDGVVPEAWVDWLIFRKAPVQTAPILLWARSDLFPGEVGTVDEPVEQIEEETNE